MNKAFELLQGLAKHYDYTVEVETNQVRLIGNGGPVFEFDSLEAALSEFHELLEEDDDRPENWEEAIEHIEEISAN